MNSEFHNLMCEAQDCRLCARMDARSRVLSQGNGPLDAKLMFIGEAPGRLGADSTQIPFHGDKAGANFEQLLQQVGLSRYDCFITNAILCNPRDEAGNNAPPARSELENCSAFLRRQIDLVNPSIVVTLGAQSLAAVSFIEPHKLNLSDAVRKSYPWYGRKLMPLYHPGQRAMLHRSFLNQLADYQHVAETFKRIRGQSRSRAKSAKLLDAPISYAVRSLLEISGELSYFQLHKLFYLLEYMHTRETGERFSRAFIVRQKDGPYVTDLHISTLRKSIPELIVSAKSAQLTVKLGMPPDLFETAKSKPARSYLDTVVHRVWEQYGTLTNERLKNAVYLTGPMRTLLRAEKYRKVSTFNQPIMFS